MESYLQGIALWFRQNAFKKKTGPLNLALKRHKRFAHEINLEIISLFQKHLLQGLIFQLKA